MVLHSNGILWRSERLCDLNHCTIAWKRSQEWTWQLRPWAHKLVSSKPVSLQIMMPQQAHLLQEVNQKLGHKSPPAQAMNYRQCKTGPPRNIRGWFRPQRVWGLCSRHFEVAQNELFIKGDQHRPAGQLFGHSPYRRGARMVLQECRTIWSPGLRLDLGNSSAGTTEKVPAYLDTVSQGTKTVQEVLNNLKNMLCGWYICPMYICSASGLYQHCVTCYTMKC